MDSPPFSLFIFALRCVFPVSPPLDSLNKALPTSASAQLNSFLYYLCLSPFPPPFRILDLYFPSSCSIPGYPLPHSFTSDILFTFTLFPPLPWPLPSDPATCIFAFSGSCSPPILTSPTHAILSHHHPTLSTHHHPPYSRLSTIWSMLIIPPLISLFCCFIWTPLSPLCFCFFLPFFPLFYTTSISIYLLTLPPIPSPAPCHPPTNFALFGHFYSQVPTFAPIPWYFCTCYYLSPPRPSIPSFCELLLVSFCYQQNIFSLFPPIYNAFVTHFIYWFCCKYQKCTSIYHVNILF